MKTVAKDTPLAEITLRKYEKPYGLDKRELVKKICLSIGILQPGDSRDIIIDILLTLFEARTKKELLSSEEIKSKAIETRKKYNLPLTGIASSNVRRQIKRLRDLALVEKVENSYRVTEFEDPSVIFEEKIEKFYLQNILNRIKDYFNALK